MVNNGEALIIELLLLSKFLTIALIIPDYGTKEYKDIFCNVNNGNV